MGTEHLDELHLRRLIEVGRDLLSELDVETVLQRLVIAARDLTGARYAALGVLDRESGELARFIAVGFDAEVRARLAHPPRGLGVLGLLAEASRPIRLADVADHPSFHGFPDGHPPMHSFLGVPIPTRGRPFGNLYLTEKAGGEFDVADEELTIVLADWAAIAIENARWAADERLRESIRSSDRERARWARELHDDTLQGLGALRLMLSSALRRGDERLDGVVGDAVTQLAEEIDKLRSLISELRPAALDEIGLEAAILGLVDRGSVRQGLDIECSLDLAGAEIDDELEGTIYRVVQEALTNVGRHARAEHVRVSVEAMGGGIALEIADDGVGFDSSREGLGFGLVGMRERVALAGGTIEVASAPGSGTTIRASVPIPGADSA